jgi:hypothetical protein
MEHVPHTSLDNRKIFENNIEAECRETDSIAVT